MTRSAITVPAPVAVARLSPTNSPTAPIGSLTAPESARQESFPTQRICGRERTALREGNLSRLAFEAVSRWAASLPTAPADPPAVCGRDIAGALTSRPVTAGHRSGSGGSTDFHQALPIVGPPNALSSAVRSSMSSRSWPSADSISSREIPPSSITPRSSAAP